MQFIGGNAAVRRWCGLLVLIVFPPLAGAAAPDFDEGEWEYETKLTMNGKPMPMPGMKYSQCVTKQDFVPQRPEQAQTHCQLVSQKVSGNSVTWTTRCARSDVTMESEGNVVYRGSGMQGTITSTTTAANKPPHTSISEITGKRIGPCKHDKPH